MSKHTPGPWYTTSEMQGIGGVKVYGVETQERYPVANCGTGNIGKDNAALIAAAPELLAALNAASEWLNDMGCEHEEPDLRCVVCLVNAAINKAEGR